jgi:hypothetical protein
MIFMRFGSGFANNYRGPLTKSLGWGSRLFIHNIVHAVCVFFQRCTQATKGFSSEFQNNPELNMFKNYKKKPSIQLHFFTNHSARFRNPAGPSRYRILKAKQ